MYGLDTSMDLDATERGTEHMNDTECVRGTEHADVTERWHGARRQCCRSDHSGAVRLSTLVSAAEYK